MSAVIDSEEYINICFCNLDEGIMIDSNCKECEDKYLNNKMVPDMKVLTEFIYGILKHSFSIMLKFRINHNDEILVSSIAYMKFGNAGLYAIPNINDRNFPYIQKLCDLNFDIMGTNLSLKLTNN